MNDRMSEFHSIGHISRGDFIAFTFRSAVIKARTTPHERWWKFIFASRARAHQICVIFVGALWRIYGCEFRRIVNVAHIFLTLVFVWQLCSSGTLEITMEMPVHSRFGSKSFDFVFSFACQSAAKLNYAHNVCVFFFFVRPLNRIARSPYRFICPSAHCIDWAFLCEHRARRVRCLCVQYWVRIQRVKWVDRKHGLLARWQNDCAKVFPLKCIQPVLIPIVAFTWMCMSAAPHISFVNFGFVLLHFGVINGGSDEKENIMAPARTTNK